MGSENRKVANHIFVATPASPDLRLDAVICIATGPRKIIASN
jgi:hypothetical protein